MIELSPKRRRILQAVLYEFGAVALVAPTLGLVFGESAASSLSLAVVLSTVALAWNYVFNALFERWEARQSVRGRSWWRRLVHGVGFEGGLATLLVPLMAWWLQISMFEALLAELGFLVLFFIYAIVYTWSFDKVFGLPASAAVR
jgi:uncharacterized membrane protein